MRRATKPQLPTIPIKPSKPRKGQHIIRSAAEERRLRSLLAKARRAALRNEELVELEGNES